jgi:hypothetical protein
MTRPVSSLTRAPTTEECQGIAWWNALSESGRVFWCKEHLRQNSGKLNASAADAWATWKAYQTALQRRTEMR